MSPSRPFALVRTGDQWVRSSFDDAFLDHEAGVVSLAWETRTAESEAAAPTVGAGLAFDSACRLYHGVPDAGRVDVVRWAARDPLAPDVGAAAPAPLFAVDAPDALGDFSAPVPDALAEPRGLAVDVDDRLFVAETAADRVLVYELWGRRLLRRIAFPGGRPTALAAHGTTVYVVLSATRRVVRCSVRSDAVDVTLPPTLDVPSRIATSPVSGMLAVLARAGTAGATIGVLDGAGGVRAAFDEPFATDVAWESERVIVVARAPGADFTRRRLDAGAIERMPPLRARGYDGLGIVRLPERVGEAAGHACTCGGACGCDAPSWRIGYWTSRGFRRAVPARLTYASRGRIVTYRLDSGAYQTIWGRIFLDACIPDGTAVRLQTVTADDVDDEPSMPRVPPGNLETVTVLRPDLSPPMPPASLLAPTSERWLHRRESGRELPWAQPPAGDPFRTYEAPIDAPAGRYLWIVLELHGATHATPRVRCVRAEHPSHDYLRRLPRLFSRDEQDASFLRRYLAIAEGFLGETEARAEERHILMHPRVAPDEALPWLASFVGLVLDERWAEAPRPGGRTADARRAILAEVSWLLRFRGTVPGLKRLLELYVGVEVVILERFRLRGMEAGARLGPLGGVLGALHGAPRDALRGAARDALHGPALSSRAGGAVAGGARAGGAVAGGSMTRPYGGGEAHRFTVLIPAALTEQQLAVVHDILDVHRPAHTIVDVCTVGAGMRVGRGLHLALSSMVGPTGGFQTAQLGAASLGRGAIVGRPSEGTTVDASRVGRDTRVR